MHLQQIRYFIEIAELGSFSQASAASRIAQSALSRQIANLETEVGAVLLNRHGHGVSLTTAGEIFLEHGRLILEQVRRAQAEIEEARQSTAGRATLAVPASLSSVIVPRLLQRVRLEQLGIDIRIIEALSSDILRLVAAGNADVGIAYTQTKPSNLVMERLLTEDLHLVGPANDPRLASGSITLAEFAALPLMLPGPQHEVRQRIDQAARSENLPLHVRMEIDIVHIVKKLVERGEGYAIQPILAVESEVREGRLSAARITDPPIARDLMLITSNSFPLSRAGRELARQIRIEFEHAATLAPGITIA